MMTPPIREACDGDVNGAMDGVRDVGLYPHREKRPGGVPLP